MRTHRMYKTEMTWQDQLATGEFNNFTELVLQEPAYVNLMSQYTIFCDAAIDMMQKVTEIKDIRARLGLDDPMMTLTPLLRPMDDIIDEIGRYALNNSNPTVDGVYDGLIEVGYIVHSFGEEMLKFNDHLEKAFNSLYYISRKLQMKLK